MSQPPDRRAADDRIRALLDDIEGLRLALGTDLIIAAAALEEERPDLAQDVVEANRSELAAFAARAEERLTALGNAPIILNTPEPTRTPRRLRAGTVLTAAALTGVLAVGAAAAAVHAPIGDSSHKPQTLAAASVASSYDDFRRLASGGASVELLVAAADRLHNSLAPLIAAAATDPASAHRALRILQRETRILQVHQVLGTERVLAAARALVAQLTGKVLGSKPKVSTPTLPLLPQPSTSPKPDPRTPKTETTTPPKPEPSAPTKPEPTAPTNTRPSPSPSPSSDTPAWPFGDPGFGDDFHF